MASSKMRAMIQHALETWLSKLALYGFGVFSFFLYLFLSLKSGAFFRKNTEKDQLQLAIARDEYWNLSKTINGVSHRFFHLRNGLKLHYLTNTPNASSCQTSKPLVIFLHGWPDSCLIWRYILQSKSLRETATLVAVDLPGYGGSDSFDFYGPGEVLEALTEFIVAMRENYIVVEDIDSGHGSGEENGAVSKVYLVGHDWGCVLAMRLAAEAPCLADRFILTNGLHVMLALNNKDRILSFSRKMLTTFFRAPLSNWHCLHKARKALAPLAWQLFLFGYMAAFQLPDVMVRYLGVGGNYAFLRGAQRASYGEDKSEYKPAESMAVTIGPSPDECQTETIEQQPEKYGMSVLQRSKGLGTFFLHSTAYYRDGTSINRWEKSIHTIAAFHNIEIDNANSRLMGNRPRKRRASSASSALFDEPYAGSLKAAATIIWGQRDQAITEKICLDGIGDYLAKDSQVVMLPKSGHFTPIEPGSRRVLQRVLEWLVEGGEDELGPTGDVEVVVKQIYPEAVVTVRK